jgi:hypothetical protein
MKKISDILSECLALIVLAKILLKPTETISRSLILPTSLEWLLIATVMFGLFFRPISTYARIGLSSLATYLFLFYEVYPLSPQSFYLLIVVTIGYFLLAVKFRKADTPIRK